MPTTPVLLKLARPPFSKPQPGCPINWGHWLTRGLVASWPMNEGTGDTLHEYASGHEFFAATWIGKNMTPPLPSWTTNDKVAALDNTSYTTGFIGNPYLTSESSAANGYPNLPQIDFSAGCTIHMWCAPFDPALGLVTGTMFSVGDRNGNQHILSVDLNHQIQGYFITVQIGNGPTFSTFNTSASCWPTIGDIPNQMVISLIADPVVAGGMLLNFWDSAGEHLIDNYSVPSTDKIQQFSEYNFNGFYISSPGTSGNGIKSYWYAANVWNRGLGEYEAKGLMYNPLQFYGANNLGGQVGGQAVPPVFNLPTVTLTATPASIQSGYTSTLSWTSNFADTLTINQSIGSVVVPSGSLVVSPTVTTTYTITATNAFGTAQASATVTVTARGGGRPSGVAEGAILQRDLTKTTDAAQGPGDNGATFSAFAVIGSVVLTHPSELALVLFITTEAIAAGSHPTVSVILDEIAPSIAVPFVSLGSFVPDPPELVAAQTIYNDRFYISQTRQPAICRHFQARFDWPAEAAANELLTWSVIGAHTEER